MTPSRHKHLRPLKTRRQLRRIILTQTILQLHEILFLFLADVRAQIAPEIAQGRLEFGVGGA